MSKCLPVRARQLRSLVALAVLLCGTVSGAALAQDVTGSTAADSHHTIGVSIRPLVEAGGIGQRSGGLGLEYAGQHRSGFFLRVGGGVGSGRTAAPWEAYGEGDLGNQADGEPKDRRFYWYAATVGIPLRLSSRPRLGLVAVRVRQITAQVGVRYLQQARLDTHRVLGLQVGHSALVQSIPLVGGLQYLPDAELGLYFGEWTAQRIEIDGQTYRQEVEEFRASVSAVGGVGVPRLGCRFAVGGMINGNAGRIGGRGFLEVGSYFGSDYLRDVFAEARVLRVALREEGRRENPAQAGPSLTYARFGAEIILGFGFLGRRSGDELPVDDDEVEGQEDDESEPDDPDEDWVDE